MPPGKVTNRPRSNALDRLYFSVPTDDERVSRRIGYVLLGVTFVLAGWVFWPYIAERFA